MFNFKYLKGARMAIAYATKNGGTIHIFDEKGKRLGSISNASKYEIQGNTATTVTVLDNYSSNSKWIRVFDEKGKQISSKSVH